MTPPGKRAIIFSVILLLFCFAIFLFLNKQQLNEAIVATDAKKDSVINTTLFSEFYDLECNDDVCTSIEKAFSGKKSSKLLSTIEYGTGATKLLKDIPSFQNLLNINVDFKCYSEKIVTDAIWVLSIDDASGKNIFWSGQPIVCNEKEKWNTVSINYHLKPDYLKPDYSLKLYPWNKNKEEFYIDDILINYNGTAVLNNNTQSSQLNSNFFFDFETAAGLSGTENFKTGTAHSGKMACDLSDGTEYGPSVIKKVGDVNSTTLTKTGASVWVYPLKDNPNVVLTLSIVNTANETFFWEGKNTENKHFPKNQWTKINAVFNIPFEKINPDDKIIVNLWNKGKDAVIVDDLEIVYGEPERKGLPSILDPVTIAEKGLIPHKNKAPFKTLLFQKQEINNENGTCLINSNNKIVGDFSPNDEFLAGNFLADKKNVDELISIQSNEVGLYGYSAANNQFQCYLQNKIPVDLVFWKNSKKLVGQFTGNGTDNILLINANLKEMRLLSFSGTSANQASTNIVWKTNTFALGNTNIPENNLFFSGDFNGDKRQDLLLLDPQTGNWNLVNFKNNTWEIVSSGNSDVFTKKMLDPKTSKQIVGKFYSEKNSDVLLVSVFDNGKYLYKSLGYNSKNKRFEEQEIHSEISEEAFFKNSDEVLAGNFDNDTEQEFLKLNTSWRFDLKQIDLNAEGFNISYSVDFKGFPKDHNPKYYEYVKVIPGNFIREDQTSLLMLMRNCADADFNGNGCKQFENLPSLPNSTQLYNTTYQK